MRRFCFMLWVLLTCVHGAVGAQRPWSGARDAAVHRTVDIDRRVLDRVGAGDRLALEPLDERAVTGEVLRRRGRSARS
jgi:hypothetical protein